MLAEVSARALAAVPPRRQVEQRSRARGGLACRAIGAPPPRSDADDDGDMMDDSVSRDGAPRISESGEAATLRFCGCLNFREGLRLRGDLHVQRRISLQLLSHQLTDSARSCLW